MFIIIILIVIFLAWKYSDWRNWQKYQPTMLLFSLGNMLYNFVYHDRYLWKMNPDVTCHHTMEVILTVTVFPLTALLFLSGFPADLKKKLIRISRYILIYIAAEYILLKLGRIEYHYGWNIWWSLGWDCMMFPVLAIHHRKPLLAFPLCTIVFFIMGRIFPYKLD
ncbi:MAG TPA: CBO0543 family protein [Clostridia bacterium]